jgi:hypothetical protein
MRLMAQSKNYEVAVSAQTQYLPDQSDESANRYVFAYTITIRNAGTVAAQLISRHWIITDAQGLVQEVRGLGVVGAQPTLQPGRSSSTPAAPRSPRRSARCAAPTRWSPRRHPLRGNHSAVHAVSTKSAALTGPISLFLGQVHQTISTASSSATPISR